MNENQHDETPLPSTLAYPDAFRRALPAGYDGPFHWEWANSCFPNPKDRLMDIDGFKDRRGQILLFETKDPGVEIPLGQRIGLETMHRTGVVSVMLVWGKITPQYGEFWFPRSRRIVKWTGVDEAKDLVTRWYQWADKRPKMLCNGNTQRFT